MKKNVSVNDMDKVIGNEPVKKVQLSDEVEATVRSRFTLGDRQEICQYVVDACFPPDKDTGMPMYAPYFFNFAFDCQVLESMTDIRLPSSVEKINAIVSSAAYDKIVDAIGFKEYVELRGQAWSMVEYRRSLMLSDIENKSRELVGALGNITAGLDTFRTTLNDIGVDKFREAVTAFGKLSPDDVAVAFQRLADKEE